MNPHDLPQVYVYRDQRAAEDALNVLPSLALDILSAMTAQTADTMNTIQEWTEQDRDKARSDFLGLYRAMCAASDRNDIRAVDAALDRWAHVAEYYATALDKDQEA